MQSIRKGIIDYLYSFKDNDFHELNEFLKSTFPDTHIDLIRSELTALSDKKKIEIGGNNHSRWGLPTPNIHPNHNVEATLDNWIVKAKLHPDEREILETQESDDKVKSLQIEVLRLEREDLILRQQNKDLDGQLKKEQLKLTQLQTKDLKGKKLWGAIGAIGSALITLGIEHAKEILLFLQRLFQ